MAGFIGVAVAKQKIEMLFFSPGYIGKGPGIKLTDLAFSELKADKVNANQQNSKAVKFYGKPVFKTYERMDKDDQEKKYPLLRMKLETTNHRQ